MFTTPVYSPRRSRFVNSAFSNNKILAQKSMFIQTNVCRNCTFQVNTRKNTTWRRRLTSRNRIAILSALHAKNDTTNLFGYKLGKSTENNKALLFFSAKETIQTFKSFKSLRCCSRSDKLVNCHVWKFYQDLFLNCRVSSWPDLSIKSYFLMVSSLILLRSLRVYILKHLFLSISVNSGFRNIYLATSWLGKYLALFTSISKNNC